MMLTIITLSNRNLHTKKSMMIIHKMNSIDILLKQEGFWGFGVLAFWGKGIRDIQGKVRRNTQWF